MSIAARRLQCSSASLLRALVGGSETVAVTLPLTCGPFSVGNTSERDRSVICRAAVHTHSNQSSTTEKQSTPPQWVPENIQHPKACQPVPGTHR